MSAYKWFLIILMRLPEVDGSSPVQLEVVKGDLESDLEVGFMNKDGHPDLGFYVWPFA